jgi:uncharacterized Ntn-hydrolase superfamily protein
MTYSIVARDPQAGMYGVAVQSKFVAIGALTPWARADAGAVATQAWINTTYGPRGLDLLASGLSAATTIEQLTAADPLHAHRQLGVVGTVQPPATYTGTACPDWAGGQVGRDYACQGNFLVGPEVLAAMAQAFEDASSALWYRLIAALTAGQTAGGDRRGQQAAALMVVAAGQGFRGHGDRLIDLRVDDHPAPIEELRRILHVRLADSVWSATE